MSVHDIDVDLLPSSGLRDVHVVALYARTKTLQRDFGTDHDSRQFAMRVWLFHLLGGRQAGLVQLQAATAEDRRDAEVRWTGEACGRLANALVAEEKQRKKQMAAAIKAADATNVDAAPSTGSRLSAARAAYDGCVSSPAHVFLDTVRRRWKVGSATAVNSVPLGAVPTYDIAPVSAV